jgi:hypothetical protein
MITDFIIFAFYLVVALIANIFIVLPNVTLPASINSAISSIGPYYQSLDLFFPISTIIDILAIELSFIAIYFTYKIIRWAYKKIPAIN